MHSLVSAKTVELNHVFMDGEIKFTVDDRFIDPEVFQKYLIIHPVGYDTNFHIPPSLRLCIEKDPKYYPCGSHDINDINFLKNAEVNLEIGKNSLEHLRTLNAYPELSELVQYFTDSLSFAIWKNELLFQYYKTWDSRFLSERYKHLQTTTTTAAALSALAKADSKNEKWHISYYDWANSVNHSYREKEGDVPAQIWNDFLSKYKITEEIKWYPVD